MKIEKIIAEISKTKKRILEMQTKLRELERMKTEKENAEIVELVECLATAKLDDLIALCKE